MKLAVLGNTNMDPLKSHLKDAFIAEMDRYVEFLLDSESILYQHKPDVILLHLDGRQLLRDHFYRNPDNALMEDLTARILAAVVAGSAHHPDAVMVLSTIVLPPFPFDSFMEATRSESFFTMEETYNQSVIDFARERSNVVVLDFARIVRLHGYQTVHDEKYWYLGRIRYSERGFQWLHREIIDLLNAHQGIRKKVLVLDLDNTLWGGVLGEEGVGGIALSEDGIGKVFRDFQLAVCSLKNLGVLLAVCSKNNAADVDAVFRDHPSMVLRKSDFIVTKIGWTNKPQSIREIAVELNLGLDSFVFIDDSPFEREMVRSQLQEVIVPDPPADPALYPTWFLEEVVRRYFGRLDLTDEDRGKTEQYQRNIERIRMKDTLSFDDFLRELAVEVILHIDPAHLKVRLAQLTQKTNQFNLTIRRYDENDLHRMIQSPDTAVFGLEYQDRFGHEGIIGEIIVHLHDQVGEIDVFLLSCRVIGRRIERRFFHLVLENLKERGIREIEAVYVPGPRNELVRDLYDSLGLTPRGENRYRAEVDRLLSRFQVDG